MVIVGGGPSLTGFDFNRLRGHKVIAVNAAGYDVPWADVLMFQDREFLRLHWGLIESWRQRVVTLERLRPACQREIETFEVRDQPDFKGDALKYGPSTGHLAISLAISLGAKRIVLLGYDCRSVDGRSHYHDRYLARQASRCGGRFLPTWAGWNAAARRAGVEVFNASAQSDLAEFPSLDFGSAA